MGRTPEGEELNLKPCAYKRSEGYTQQCGCLTACLLHNDPASYRQRLVKIFRIEAKGKPSLNRAFCRWW